MITGLNLFHFVALTPTSFNECPGAKSTATPLPPPSIVSPDIGYTFKFTAVSFNINVSKPAAQSGSETPWLAVAVVTILYDFVKAVAPAKHSTGISFSIHDLISKNPGSEIPGVPASLIMAIEVPFFNFSIILFVA